MDFFVNTELIINFTARNVVWLGVSGILALHFNFSSLMKLNRRRLRTRLVLTTFNIF